MTGFGIATVLLVFAIFRSAESVSIWIISGEDLAFQAQVSPQQTVLSFKEQISAQVNLCPPDIQIIDNYRNAQQDADGFGEYLDHKTLSEYGITEYTRGKLLYAVRRVIVNDLIVPTKNFATVAYLDYSAMKLVLDGSQTVWEFRQLMAIYLSCENVSRLIVIDWYAGNPAIDSDGGWPLNERPLSHYGWDSYHTGVVLYLAVEVENYLQGDVTIFYGKGWMQTNIPFEETQTVLEFRTLLSQLTEIPVADLLIFDYVPNPAQDADGGIWQDNKTLFQYGMRNGQAAAFCLAQRISEHDINTRKLF